MAIKIKFVSGTKLIPLSQVLGFKFPDNSLLNIPRDFIASRNLNPPEIVLEKSTRYYISTKSGAIVVGHGVKTTVFEFKFIEEIVDTDKNIVLWPSKPPPKKSGGGRGFEFL